MPRNIKQTDQPGCSARLWRHVPAIRASGAASSGGRAAAVPTSTTRSSCSWAVGRDAPCSALGIQIAWGKGGRGVELTLCASKLPGETGKTWPHPYQGALCRGRKTAWAIYKRSSWATSVLCWQATPTRPRKSEGKGAVAREKPAHSL